MALFNSIKKSATDAAEKTMQKAKDITETTKLNSQIDDEEKKIESCYAQIGRQYVELYGKAPEDAFADAVAAICESQKKIKEYRDQIRAIKGVVVCEKCGAEISPNDAFCSSCGAPAPKPEDSSAKCPSCGADLTPGAKFCTACGSAIQQSEKEAEDEAGSGDE